MCVIIYKPAKTKLPELTTISKAMRANPHGYGFCTPTKNYKTLDKNDFLNQLYKINEDEPCLIHCRLATHGSIKESNCHPFYDAEKNVFFMHNGILNIDNRDDMTDSETAFRDFLAPKITTLRDGKLTRRVNQIIGYSKFAFMQGDKVRLYGDFIKKGDCFYSNLRFMLH